MTNGLSRTLLRRFDALAAIMSCSPLVSFLFVTLLFFLPEHLADGHTCSRKRGDRRKLPYKHELRELSCETSGNKALAKRIANKGIPGLVVKYPSCPLFIIFTRLKSVPPLG